MLAAAYLSRSLVPLASTLPTSVSLVSFHATSALWYTVRAPRIAATGQRCLAWISGDQVHSVKSQAASFKMLVMFVSSSVLQWPVSAPSAAAFPFVACCTLGLETSIGSNVVLLSQTLCLVVAIVFDGAILLPLLTTALALVGFGVSAERADPACFAMACAGHLVFALLGMMAWVQIPSVHKSYGLARLDVLSAMFCAVLCAEARVRAATSAVCTRKQVIVASRAAALGCVPALAFRGLAEKSTSTPHIGTVALGCVAACSPWFWNVHRAWRAQRTSPPEMMKGEALMLGVVFVFLLLMAFALPPVDYFALQ